MEDGSLGIDVADHLEDVFEIERRAQLAMAHGAAGGEGHFTVLQMETRGGKAIEIAGMIVVEVGDDHVGDAIGLDADEAQGIDWMANPFTAAANGGFVGEAGVEDEGGVAAARDPDEIVEVGGEFVRIGGNEIFLRMAVAEMAVTNSEKFKWFDRHGSLSTIDRMLSFLAAKDESWCRERQL